MLESYKGYGFYTNPGEFESLYESLPHSVPELCELIKAQLIYPVVDLPLYREQIPPERGKRRGTRVPYGQVHSGRSDDPQSSRPSCLSRDLRSVGRYANRWMLVDPDRKIGALRAAVIAVVSYSQVNDKYCTWS